MKYTADNPLGTQPIGKLLANLALPAIIANIVSALYNIVDQIFISRGVGYLGNAATNIAFPFTTICTGISLMLGMGGASTFNIELGKGNIEKAQRICGTTISTLFILGILLSILFYALLHPLLVAFGATDTVLTYALSYTQWMIPGIPFFMVSTGMAALVRADGNSSYSMACLIIGTIINTALNPFFIFICHFGVAGSAMATVISQVISCALFFVYIPQFRSVTLAWHHFIPRLSLLKYIAYVGLASFIYQITNTVVLIISNNLFDHYGQYSIYGNAIPIAIAGISTKMYFVYLAISFGIVQGMQPIIGYNYGAKQYDRVRRTLFLSLATTTICSLFFFAIYELFPSQIIHFFGGGSPLYYDFAVQYIHIANLLLFVNGFLIAGTIFFSSIGKSLISSFLCLMNQVVFTIPLLFILPKYFGVLGIAWNYPASAGLSFFLVSFFIIRELYLESHSSYVQQHCL